MERMIKRVPNVVWSVLSFQTWDPGDDNNKRNPLGDNIGNYVEMILRK